MAADGTSGPVAADRLAPIFAAFVREVFTPLVTLSSTQPADGKRILDEIRSRLDVVEGVIATTSEAASYALPTQLSKDLASLEEADGAPLDEIGRNQRSRVRELVLLEYLGREAKAFSLQQLMAALAQKGFQDTPSAVVSQLHRLKKLELIRQPQGSTGMYEITTAGLGHARNLRSSFGAYLPV
jgi:hypothetical protein